MNAPAPLRTALSLAVHEAPAAIVDQCLNNLLVGGFDAIVLHVDAQCALDTGRLAQLIEGVPPLRGRVHLNPTRLPTAWVAPGLLHRAHIANFHWLRTQCEFDVFATDACNTLLLDPGLKSHLGTHAMGIDALSPFGWQSPYEAPLRADPLFEQAGEHCRRNQIEGLFARTEHFAQIADWIAHYDAAFDRRHPNPLDAPRLPREEYLFATALTALGLADAGSGTAYILMRMGSQLAHPQPGPDGEPAPLQWALHQCAQFGWETMEVGRSLKAGRLLPLFWELRADTVPEIPDLPAYCAGKFGIKRVVRQVDDPIRRLVGDHFGYRGWTLEAQALAS